MSERKYWFVPFSGESWQAFFDAGGHSLAFGGQSVRRSADVRPGDYLLCGLMGIARFVGVLNVLDVKRDDRLADLQSGRCRLTLKPLIQLTAETGLPAVELKSRLGCFHASGHPHGWMKCFWRAFIPWAARDGEKVVSALLKVRQHPVKRPLGGGVLSARPQACDAAGRLVTTVHAGGACVAAVPFAAAGDPGPAMDRQRLVQAFFLKLGRALGYDTWIPAQNRQCKVGGRPLGMWPGVRSGLQLAVPGMARRVLENMDVLWLENRQAQAAFAIEGNGTVLAALQDIADFLVLQPDTCLPFYLVAPDGRRPDVIRQINRAAFAPLPLPPTVACRFISFRTIYRMISRLREEMPRLTPTILLEISESCEPAEAV